MKGFVALLSLLAVGCHGVEKPSYYATDLILTSPQLTRWGEWYPWEYCPEDTYVTGMSLKTEPYNGVFADDTSLNGIKLYCGPIGYRFNNVTVASGVNDRGSFGRDSFCEGVATGFQLRSEPYQTVFADDTAANNLRLFCNNKRDELIEGDGLDFGEWTAPQQCFSKQAICGIQTQVEMEHGNADETALNNINVKCCDVPDPADVCLPEDRWDLLIECDNMEAVTPTTCGYERRVGISHSTTESGSYYELNEIYTDLGFGLSGAPSGLSINFEFNLGWSHTTGHNWTMTNTEIWSVETTTSVEFDVPPGVKTQLLQTVGNCGIYDVKATRVKRIDTEAETLKETISYIEI